MLFSLFSQVVVVVVLTIIAADVVWRVVHVLAVAVDVAGVVHRRPALLLPLLRLRIRRQLTTMLLSLLPLLLLTLLFLPRRKVQHLQLLRRLPLPLPSVLPRIRLCILTTRLIITLTRITTVLRTTAIIIIIQMVCKS
jgi:hypothetical protein